MCNFEIPTFLLHLISNWILFKCVENCSIFLISKIGNQPFFKYTILEFTVPYRTFHRHTFTQESNLVLILELISRAHAEIPCFHSITCGTLATNFVYERLEELAKFLMNVPQHHITHDMVWKSWNENQRSSAWTKKLWTRNFYFLHLESKKCFVCTMFAFPFE